MAVVLAGILLAGCKPRTSAQQSAPIPVTVAKPVRQDVADYYEQTGQLAAIKTVPLLARVEGYLTDIGYRDGERVEQGRMLFTIEQPPYKANLDKAAADLTSSEAKATFAEQQFQRYTALAKDQFAAQMQAQQYTADRNSTAAAVAQSRAALEQAGITYSYTVVTAPFAGKVSAHLRDVGALVGTSQAAQLATIVQMDPIWVNFNLSELDALRARAARAKETDASDIRGITIEVGLQNEDGYPHRGHLDYVAPAIDPGTGTLAVRGLFDNADGTLLPGSFVRVRVPIRVLHNALLVPDEAIGNTQGEPILLVVDANNTVAQRAVELGPKQGSLRVVSGIDPDQRVITEGAQRVTTGSVVTPHEGSSTQAASQ